jgi:very-short-patch-repair endonuclease
MIKYLYLPYNKNLKASARKMRNEMTTAEKKLWLGYLRQDNHRWLRQKPIGDFIVDFYCSELKLIIEVDGATHLESQDIINDRERNKKLEKLGLKILRFWNDDVLNGLGEVANIIEEEINKIKSPQPPLSRGR